MTPHGQGRALAGGVIIGVLAMIAIPRWWVHREEGSLQVENGRLSLEPRPPAPQDVAAEREARLATLSLADQNAKLRTEVRESREHARRLTEALAAVRIEADLYKARTDPAALDAEWRPEGVLDVELRVREINPDLRMVILDGGRQQGVLPGMRLAVLRGNRPIARLVVVDVRPGLAGAVVDEARPGQWPEAGDRVVPAKAEKNLR